MTCSFVPPYLLRVVADRAESRHACVAGESTLQLDHQLRSRRILQPADQLPTPVRAESTVASATGPGTRVVHTAVNAEVLPGDVVRDNDDPPSGDVAVDEAHDSSGVVLDLFLTQFGRQSADGRGGVLSITVHYGRNYDNAFWDGNQLVFGDGDGQVFDRFTKPMDVMAHEFTHAVTQFTAGLTYQGQSGALNESVSDVFASMSKQRALGQTVEQADWLIGEGIFQPGVKAKALRSMVEPGTAYDDPQIGKDPQVGSMADYVDTSEDSGGVHINSGIPNRAFALAALAIGGSSWERAGKVWYDALTSGEVRADADFVSFADATISSAGRLFAGDASVATQVRAAWTAVGVLSDGAPADAVPSGSTPAVLPAPPIVAVRRTGGFAGMVTTAELDLDADPQGPEVRHLLSSVDVAQISAGRAIPDGFVYTVEYGDWQLTLPEHDLTPELHRVVQLVLDPARSNDLTLE